MKNLNWKQWTAIGIITAVIIAIIVLHFVQPQVSFAFTEVVAVASFVVGGITGYLLKKNDVIKSDKQILND